MPRFLLVVLWCTCCFAQTELLHQVAANYAAAASVQAQGNRVTLTLGDGYEQRVESAFTLHLAKGGKLREESHEPSGIALQVSDGLEYWTYTPASRTYRKLTGGTVQQNPDILHYERLDQGVKFVRQLRTESVGGVECAVLEVQYDTLARLWIDPRKLVVMKQEVAMVSTTFAVVQLNLPVQPEWFTFHAPAGAREAAVPPLLPVVLPSLRDLNGKAVFDFELPGVDGKRYRLSDLKGKVVILDFWATWCAPCRADMPEIEKFYRRNKDGGVVVIGINAGEDAETVKAFLKGNGKSFTYPIVLGGNSRVTRDYQVRAYPTAFAISRQGAIAGSQIGARGQLGMNELLAAADVSETAPAPREPVGIPAVVERPVLRRLTESAPLQGPNGTVLPQIQFKEEPGYTDQARRAHLSGTVLIGLDVLPDGKPRNVRVVRPLGLGLDEAAVQAVEKWRFEPGSKDGQVVTVPTTVEVSFRMLDAGDGWSLKRAQVEGPALIRYVAPETHNYGVTAEITVSFEIGETGRTRDIRFAGGVDRHMANDIRDAVAQFVFSANLPGRGSFVFASPGSP